MKLLSELREYQKIGARKIWVFSHTKNNNGALLADDMGLGKSIQSLYYCLKVPQRRPVLIVCPANVKYGWEDELKKHFNQGAIVLEGKKPKVNSGNLNLLFSSTSQFVIINYDILKYWIPFLKRMKFKIMIVDECHYIKNTNTQRYKAVEQMHEKINNIIGLSGTPLTNNPSELWPILNLINPKAFPAFFPFAMRYTKADRTPWGWRFTGGRHLKELHKKLKKICMIRRLKKDVMKELPPKNRVPLVVKLESYTEYNKIKNDFIKWLTKKSIVKAKKAKRAETLVKMRYLLDAVADKKIDIAFDWIDSFLEESNGKLVIFAQRLKTLERLRERYGNKIVIINGSVTGKKRFSLIRAFKDNKKIRLFGGQTQAAGVGINGLQVAEYCLFLDLPWTPGELIQAEDRLHRMGQTGNVTIYYMLAKNTIEEKQSELLSEKQKIIEKTLNGSVDKAGIGTNSIMDEMLKLIC